MSDETERNAELDEVLRDFDVLNGAIDRVLTALPEQMTAAAERLTLSRRIMRDTMHRYAFGAYKAADKAKP